MSVTFIILVSGVSVGQTTETDGNTGYHSELAQKPEKKVSQTAAHFDGVDCLFPTFE